MTDHYLEILMERSSHRIIKFLEMDVQQLKIFKLEKEITPRIDDLAFVRTEQKRQDWPIVEILEFNGTGRTAKVELN
ncbi:hypothetical protein DERF_015947 [Dermatophagoides farinae]|uniref:Uncharacterized protein n=1 Tax=Dermatophagoides farinae TaxID=6954 RepID=A0A922KRV3_DERFA|nr:hypothetical protein DERF_015947 [Dermatophagoides farinae]